MFEPAISQEYFITPETHRNLLSYIGVCLSSQTSNKMLVLISELGGRGKSFELFRRNYSNLRPSRHSSQ